MATKTSARKRPPALIAGVDEAGLGPTLGPLVIGAFATRGPSDLFGALGPCVGPPGCKDAIEIGDSKRIHTGVHKLARLEQSALACWMWTFDWARPPKNVRELLESVALAEGERVPDLRAPWYRDLDEALPVACELGPLLERAEALKARAKSVGLHPTLYRADLISAAMLNRELALEVELDGSKNTWVVRRTLALVEEAVERLGERSEADTRKALIEVICDKAGSRDNYTGPLEAAFPSYLVEAVEQRRPVARYRLDGLLAPGPPFEVSFLMKADDLEPRVSIAACLAKYLRELSMRAFNRYFEREGTALGHPPAKITAGYPQDARRFIEARRSLARERDLADALWIRAR